MAKFNKSSTYQFVKKAREIFGETYDYSKVQYISSKEKVEIICKEHGSFWKSPNSHISISKKQGCPKCGMKQRITKRLLGTAKFIIKAKEIHGDKYDYSMATYINSHTKLEIVCSTHGAFWQEPTSHLSGQGCSECAVERRAKVKTSDTEKFIKKAKEIHGDKYDYSKANYINSKTKIEILCLKHGSFLQIPSTHLSGGGCYECGNEARTVKNAYNTKELIETAKEVHGDRYDYSKTEYVSNKKEIEIICKKHGSFWQRPDNHLNRKSGCPRCSKTISKLETQWLDSLNIPNDKNHRNVPIKVNNKKFKVDGFDPITNTVYEFNGDFWHGNPMRYNSEDFNIATHKTFGELYQKTIKKEQILISAGYKVVSIWEADFIKEVSY